MNESYSAWKKKRGRKTEIPSKYHQLVEKYKYTCFNYLCDTFN